MLKRQKHMASTTQPQQAFGIAADALPVSRIFQCAALNWKIPPPVLLSWFLLLFGMAPRAAPVSCCTDSHLHFASA
jgi:hypothetical protein